MTREPLVVALALVALAACGGTDACIAGREGCPCAPGNTCESTPDAPLTCDRGWCVPRDCARGSEGCGCYANGTCDPLDGVPMTCEGNVCHPTVEPEAGALNGRCLEGNVCGDHEGARLACVRGRCEIDGCPSGAIGCPCASFGACDPYGTEQPICADGRCAIAGCAEGSDGCACRGDGSCDAGTCQRGLCLAEPGTPLEVEGDVRACEIVIAAQDAEAIDATFADGVLGHARRRGDELAVAIVHRRDRPFPSAPARVVVTPRRRTSGRPAPAEPRLVSATCFDRLGHRAGGAHVRLGDPP